MIIKQTVLTILGALILLSSPVWGAEVWQASGFENSPGDTDSIAAGAGKIRATREEARQRADVEHFWGTTDDTSDDNGLHRLGGARCFYSTSAPTVLSNTAADYDNTGGGNDETDLDNSATNSAAAEEDDVGAGRCWVDLDGADGEINEDCTADVTPSACCTGLDAGTCNVDNNKLYSYIGVAGDAGSCASGKDCGWVEVKTQHDNPSDFVVSTEAGGVGTANNLTNNDFEWDGCTGTSDPSQWASTDATLTYANTDTTEGDGCEAIVTATAGNGRIEQVLSNLQASTTYQVVARAHSDGIDTCEILTTGAATQLSGQTTISATYVTLTGTFITAAALDAVTLALRSNNNTDVCSWDHVGVYRLTSTEIPEAGIVAVYDTYVTSDGADIEEEATGYADVPELSITFVPPTEGWIIAVTGNISFGCDESCNEQDTEGVICRLEKGGSEIAGTVRATLVEDVSLDWGTSVVMDTIDINPTAGTSITYTVGCKEIGTLDAIFNPETANTDDTESSLSMIAYPPH